MSEAYKFYLQLVEKIREAINNKFSDGMEEQINLSGFTPDKQKEVLKKHKDDIRKEVLKSLDDVRPEIEKMKSGAINDRTMTLFPGLYLVDKDKKQLAMNEQNNALMIFNSSWPNGNMELIFTSLRNAIESKQYVVASTLIDLIESSEAKSLTQEEAQKTLQQIKKDYYKTIGVDVYDEKLNILNYADNLNKASKILVERSEITGEERLYLPEYPVKEFEDRMLIADIELKTGIDFNLEESGPSWGMEPSEAEASSGAGS